MPLDTSQSTSIADRIANGNQDTIDNIASKIERYSLLYDGETARNKILEAVEGVDADGIDTLLDAADLTDEYDAKNLAEDDADDTTLWSRDEFTPDTATGSKLELRSGDLGPRIVQIHGQPDPMNEDEESIQEVANFAISIESVLRDEQNRLKYDVKIRSVRGEEVETQIESAALSDLRKFRQQVVDLGKSFVFSGGTPDLNELKKFVTAQAAPDRFAVSVLGIHDDEFVTPDGAITKNGVPDDPEHRYTPPGSDGPPNIAKEMTLDVEEETDEQQVREFVSNVWRLRPDEEIIPAIGFVLCSGDTPRIRDVEKEIATLAITGETGSGKSKTGRILMRALGHNGNPGGAEDSAHAKVARLAGANCIPAWLDEYKPSDMTKYKHNQLTNKIRRATDGGIDSKGTPGLGTKDFKLQTPVLLTGEERLTGGAEERRTIQVRLTAITTGEEKYKEVFNQIMGIGSDANKNGINEHHFARYYWQHILRQQESKELAEQWSETKSRMFRVLEEHDIDIESIRDLKLVGFTQILRGLEHLRRIGEEVEADVPSEERVENVIAELATQAGDQNRTTHTGELLQYVCRAINAGYLRRDGEFEESPGDYKFVNKGEASEQLCLKLGQALDKVRKYIKDHDADADLLSSARDYKNRAEEHDCITASQPSGAMGRTYRVATVPAEEEFHSFEYEDLNAVRDNPDTTSN